MCGISGFKLTGRLADPEAVLDAMVDVVAHRGPDARGTWLDLDEGIALGHRRLAVVGLGQAGAQPMASGSGRWVVTYNGELYGAEGVAERLASEGRRFRGTSDTEVLVEAIDAWGPRAALEAIDGMFAFAAWDREERRLVLARDRMGEKPLAYASTEDGFAFASELRSLRAMPGFDAGLDPAAVALFLRFKYVPAPWTIHAGARKLPAGHWLVVERDGSVGEPEPYWSLADVVTAARDDRLPDDQATLDLLDDVLRRAVRDRLRSDVPLGAFLSGGIDSSLVATLATEQLDAPLRTFTIGSPDRDLDEAAQARVVAGRLGAAHTELVVTETEARAEVPTLAARWDEPFADSSQLPTHLVARLARRDVVVALSGDGGDELFGGYNRHQWLPSTWSRAGRLPPAARRALARGLGVPSPRSWDRWARLVPAARRPRLLGLKVEKMATLLGAPDAAAAYGRVVSHWQDPAALVPGAVEPPTLAHDPGAWPSAGSLAEQFMAVDALTYLPDDVLVKVDRATMAHGLEARVPLLGREVVELSARLPLSMKVRGAEGKWALRELLARRHPRALFEQPKSGFGVPIGTWLRGELRPWAEELLRVVPLAEAGLAPDPIRAAWAEHLAGRRDRSYELWDVLMLQGWREAVLDG